MRKTFYLLAAYCLLFSAYSTAHDWFEQHVEFVNAKAHKQRVPGYVLAMVEKGQAAKLVYYGKTHKRGTKINGETVFRLASVSKTFTAMLMARLVEQKLLAWEDPIAALSPGLGFSNHANIRLHHVIGQSSGFTPNAYDNLIEANYDLPRVLKMLAKLDPLCTPGKCYTYQNALFGLFDNYFTQRNGSYAQTLNMEIVQPLGLKHTSVGREALQANDNWARPHVAIAKRAWRKVKVKDHYYRYEAAAGVNASSDDLIVWLRAMLGEFPDVVSPSMVAQLTEPGVKSRRELARRDWRKFLQDAHYGLGWRIYNFKGQPLNYHGGWVQGYRADIAFAPNQKVAYVMLMNAESNLINEFTAQFWRQYFEHAQQHEKSPS